MNTHNKIWMTVVIIVVCIIILGGVTWAAVWYYNHSENEEVEITTNNQCEDIVTDDWLTYQNGYSISYPKDWVYEELEVGMGATQWSVKFGPAEDNYLVYLGLTAKDLGGYIEDLENGEMNQITEQYQLLDQTEVSFISENDILLTLQGPESYKTYSFYLKPSTNLLPIFLGPSDASSDQFENCEPEIYLKMLASYQIAQVPSGGDFDMSRAGQEEGSDSNSDEYMYNDIDCGFSFTTPTNWQMTDRYFYSTAGGSEALVPTIVFEPTQPTIDASANYIRVNMRQSFCPDIGSLSQEPASAGSDRIIDFHNLDGEHYCAEIELIGLNKNGISTTHHFLMMYDSSVDGNTIFKSVISSYGQ